MVKFNLPNLPNFLHNNFFAFKVQQIQSLISNSHFFYILLCEEKKTKNFVFFSNSRGGMTPGASQL